MGKQNHPEQQIQRAILQYISMQYPKALVFAVPNGGYRTKIEASIFKGLGVKAGVADLCILWRSGKVGFLEVKSLTGRLTTHQQSFQRRCDELGVPFACVASVDATKDALKNWKVA